MAAWPHVTKSHPCPVCGKTDWCQFGDKAVKCMRESSDRACPSGGWYHFPDPGAAPVKHVERPKREQHATIDAAGIMKELRSATSSYAIQAMAHDLGVLPAALLATGAAFAPSKRLFELKAVSSPRGDGAWAFPMKDGDGSVIGIRLRNKDAFKWAVPGSRQGIFIPEPEVEVQPVAYLPEGPTDTAAGLSMGLYTIGRPTCQSGNEQVAETLKRLGIYRAVIVADNDDMKKIGTRDGRPGIEGATKMKKDLKSVNSVIFITPSPCKDMRKLLQSGGTRLMIESQIKNKVWSKG